MAAVDRIETWLCVITDFTTPVSTVQLWFPVSISAFCKWRETRAKPVWHEITVLPLNYDLRRLLPQCIFILFMYPWTKPHAHWSLPVAMHWTSLFSSLCYRYTSTPAGNRPHPSKATPTYFVEGDPRVQFCLPTVDPRIHFALVCGAKVSLSRWNMFLWQCTSTHVYVRMRLWWWVVLSFDPVLPTNSSVHSK